MKPRPIIAFVLFLGGLAIVLYGLGFALRELIGLYAGAIDTPLDTPAGGEKGISDRMIHFVIIGAVGLAPMLVGSAMLGMGVIARILKKLNRR